MTTDPAYLAKLAPNLDSHLLLPLIDFAIAKSDAPDQFRAARVELLQRTLMIDTLMAELPAGAPQAANLEKKKKKFEKQFQDAMKQLGKVVDVFFTVTDDEGIRLRVFGSEFDEQKRHGKFSMANLQQEHSVSAKNVNALYDVGFQLVAAGAYAQAADVLKVYNVISEKRDSQDRIDSAQWGHFMCDCLLGYTDSSRDGLEALRNQLESMQTATVSRVWLLHWALFHYFKRGETSLFLDHIFNIERTDRDRSFLYTNVIQSAAPHLLRYVAAAAVLNKKKKSHLRRAARVVDQESYQYTDAVTQFVHELCGRSNFTRATALLAECDKQLAQDYFLCDLRAEFLNNARMLIFEDQLRVHKSISIANAAQQLEMTSDKAEVWLVDLIREAKIDATVDSVAGTVRVNVASNQKTVWQHVMDQLENAERQSVVA